jgi:FlaA1/EpsC-like NDP-sugar epimerase
MKDRKSETIRICIMVVCDALISFLGALFALALRFDMTDANGEFSFYFQKALHCMPAFMIITIAVMMLFKLYRRVWTYATTKELFDVLKACLVIEAMMLGYSMLFQYTMPRSFWILDFVMIAIMHSAMRFSKVFINSLRGKVPNNKINKRVMIVGAGSAAAILLKDLERPESNARAVCAIDDNPNKKNKYLMGIPIVGDREDIKRSVKAYDVNEIIIAMPSAPAEQVREIISICQDTKIPIRILPSVTSSLSSSIISELRPVSYEDLLGRDPVVVDSGAIGNFIKGKVVMVTGGGGSIGSELCRQIVNFQPKKLIIFDIYENNAYDIQMELERHHPEANVSVLIGSVRDYDRLEFVFKKYKPNIIYHAAAHKHVPLMEKSPNEAIKNNCLGTLNVAKLADKYKCDNFTLISTDKAVRPTNIMGASKRICEMITQVYARKSEYTRYSAVRFGNVLGSNGSVIPLFLKQIEEGGPVTVTHREIRRFFMTIPEAVSLVLQASLYAAGGEIFVLDMGKPVNIYELAENLIRLKGFRPNEDIEIQITGLRPGEKLYEEVLMDEEGLEKTANEKIFIGSPIKMDDAEFMKQLDALIKEAYKNGTHIKEMTEEVCGTYTITDND